MFFLSWCYPKKTVVSFVYYPKDTLNFTTYGSPKQYEPIDRSTYPDCVSGQVYRQDQTLHGNCRADAGDTQDVHSENCHP